MKILMRIDSIHDFLKASVCGAGSEQILVLGSSFPPTGSDFFKL